MAGLQDPNSPYSRYESLRRLDKNGESPLRPPPWYLAHIHNQGMGGGGGAARPEASQLSQSLNDMDWEFLGDDRDVLPMPRPEQRDRQAAGPAFSPRGETGLEGTCIDPDIEAAVQDILAGGDGTAPAPAPALLDPSQSHGGGRAGGSRPGSRRRVMKSPIDVERQQQRWAEREANKARKMAAKYGGDGGELADRAARDATIRERTKDIVGFSADRLGPGDSWVSDSTVKQIFTDRDPLAGRAASPSKPAVRSKPQHELGGPMSPETVYEIIKLYYAKHAPDTKTDDEIRLMAQGTQKTGPAKVFGGLKKKYGESPQELWKAKVRADMLAAKLEDEQPSGAERQKMAFGSWYIPVSRWKARPGYEPLIGPKEERVTSEAKQQADAQRDAMHKLKKSAGLTMFLKFVRDNDGEVPKFLQAAQGK